MIVREAEMDHSVGHRERTIATLIVREAEDASVLHDERVKTLATLIVREAEMDL